MQRSMVQTILQRCNSTGEPTDLCTAMRAGPSDHRLYCHRNLRRQPQYDAFPLRRMYNTCAASDNSIADRRLCECRHGSAAMPSAVSGTFYAETETPKPHPVREVASAEEDFDAIPATTAHQGVSTHTRHRTCNETNKRFARLSGASAQTEKAVCTVTDGQFTGLGPRQRMHSRSAPTMSATPAACSPTHGRPAVVRHSGNVR